MTQEQAINYLTSSGMTPEQVMEVVEALTPHVSGDREEMIERLTAFKNGWENPKTAMSDFWEEVIKALPPVEQKQGWIPVSEQLPELNRPLLVTAYHRVCYAYMISESGNWGYPVFRLHEMCGRSWVQETASHEPYSTGRIDAWMYLDMPEPYKMCGGDNAENKPDDEPVDVLRDEIFEDAFQNLLNNK